MDFTDLASIRLAVTNSVGSLSWDVRSEIAQKQLAADAEREAK